MDHDRQSILKQARSARPTAPALRSTPLSSAPARPGLRRHQGGRSPPKLMASTG